MRGSNKKDYHSSSEDLQVGSPNADVDAILYGQAPRTIDWDKMLAELSSLIGQQGLEKAWEQMIEKCNFSNVPEKYQNQISSIFSWQAIEAINTQLHDPIFKYRYKEEKVKVEADIIKDKIKTLIQKKLTTAESLKMDDILGIFWTSSSENSPYKDLVFQAMSDDHKALGNKYFADMGHLHREFINNHPQYLQTAIGRQFIGQQQEIA